MAELSPLGLGVVADAAIYAALAVGLLRLRMLRIVDPSNPSAVYGKLERALSAVYPDAKADTLRELLERAKRTFPEQDWEALQREFEEYEAYRYGGRPKPKSAEATLRFAKSVRRKKD